MRLHTQSLTAAVAAASLLLIACGAPADESEPADAPAAATGSSVPLSEDDLDAAGIQTAPARLVERADALLASGTVALDERRTARVGSLVEGVVETLPVQLGDQVAQGALLAMLHSHVVHDAWAMYFTAQANRRRLDTELAYAETAESRAARLVEDRALSVQELERARADLNAVRQQVAAADAEIVRSRQELHHYGIEPRPDSDPEKEDSVPVVAPIGGVVIERPVTQGTAVTPGTPLVVLSDLTRVWVLAEIDETLLGRVATGTTVTVRSAAYPGETFEGRLAAIGDLVNPQTRRVSLRVEVANPGRRLKPQMFVSAEVPASAPRPVLVVPTRAVQAMEGETVVFVRSAAGTFTRRAVATGTERDDEIEIVRGLEEGDVVATAGAFLLKSELLAPAGEEP